MTDTITEAVGPREKLDWDERWENLIHRVDPHTARVLAGVSVAGLVATLAVTGTQLYDWLERDQGLRAGAVPVTFLLLAVTGFWAGFLPFRTDRHFVIDVPAVTAAAVLFYGVQWGMIPATHPQTVSWWIWHTALVTLLGTLLLILPGTTAILVLRALDTTE